jgi:uncharacterized protein (DUF4415 family)
MKKHSTHSDSFTASNGFAITYAPDTEHSPAPPLDSQYFAAAKDVLPPVFWDAMAELQKTKPMGRPPIANPKQRISLRLDAELLAALRATGKGWQTRVNHLLMTAMEQNRL